MSLASGHHRIMVATRGALVIMVLGKVEKVVLDHGSSTASSVGSLNKVTNWRLQMYRVMRSVGEERKRKGTEFGGSTIA